MTLKSETVSKVCELFQLFIQTAQDSQAFCHGVALRVAFHTTPAQIQLRGTQNVTDDATTLNDSTASMGDVIGPQRPHVHL